MNNSLLNEKESALKKLIIDLESVVVAYSGGVDSSLLAYWAKSILGERATVVIAVSPSLSRRELDFAREQARKLAFDLLEIHTGEIDNPDYQRNDMSRCYYCKSMLFTELEKIADSRGCKYIVCGENEDDQDDIRPGRVAQQEHKIISPLKDVGLCKSEIRDLAKSVGLPSWNRPASACLSSRLPTHEPVTSSVLQQIEQAEAVLHEQGFKQVRVRHHGDLARIELALDELPLLSANIELMSFIADKLKELGYKYVTLDMQGYRQGSSNRELFRTNAECQHGQG